MRWFSGVYRTEESEPSSDNTSLSSGQISIADFRPAILQTGSPLLSPSRMLPRCIYQASVVAVLLAMSVCDNSIAAPSSGSTQMATQPLYDVFLYQETTGKKQKNFQWRQDSSGQGEVITVTEENAAFSNHCDRKGNTYAWNFENGSKTSIRVIREGNLLKISGIFSGNSIETTESIDDRPWYQPLSFSLRSFLDTSETRTSFWTIRSDTLEVVAMQAKKGNLDEITVAGKKVLARKVTLSRQGILAAFWQANFWFRESDRIFIRYQGTHGPPGTSETVVHLLQEFEKG